MYTIGQFSRISRVSAKTLRFYDEVGLLKPAQVDSFTQYRYYSPEQVADILLISELKEYSFSLEEIRNIISRKDVDYMQQALAGKLEELELQMDRIAQSKAALTEKIKSLYEGSKTLEEVMNYRIEVVERQPIAAASIRKRVRIEEVGFLIAELFKRMSIGGLQPIGPAMALYYDEEYNPESVDVEECVPVSAMKKVEGLTIREIEGGRFVSTIHVGPYYTIGKAYAALLRWTAENGYVAAEPYHEKYLVGPENTNDEQKYVTETSFPIVKKG
ncbi:MAG: MerR family transcriptional regulator [Bacillota bacterium]